MFFMETEVIREKLQGYINTADEEKLHAIYILLKDTILENSIYDDVTLGTLYERREKHLTGQSKSFTANESLQMIRNRIH